MIFPRRRSRCVALAAAVVACSGPQKQPEGGCTKDTDCKGERICEKQICMEPITSPLSGKSALKPAVGPTHMPKDSIDAVSQALQIQLSCTSNPEPGKALKALRTRGYIGQKPKLSIDGMNIYAVVKPLTVFGFRVLEVTGWEPNGDPSLFGRGPGTAPPLNIQAVVDGVPFAVKAEVQKRFGKASSVNKATYSDYPKPAAEITCYGK